MVSAEAKVGKTRSMIKLASTALKNGFNVFVVNLEMRQHEMEQLIDQEVLKITHKSGTAVIPYFVKKGEKFDVNFMKKEYIGASKDDFAKHWQAEKLFNPHAQIITRTYPQKTALVSDIKDELEILRDTHNIELNYETLQYKEMGVLHASCVVNRHVYFNLKNRVIILTNYGIGQSMLDSIWEKDLGNLNSQGMGENFSLFQETKEELADYDDFSDYFD